MEREEDGEGGESGSENPLYQQIQSFFSEQAASSLLEKEKESQFKARNLTLITIKVAQFVPL